MPPYGYTSDDDYRFQQELRAFMPQWNAADTRERMQKLEQAGQQRGWEYQMLSDSQRPGWNVPQGYVGMSAGNQHVNQLMQYADKGVLPSEYLLDVARNADDSWNQGGPVTKLPMISAIGDLMSGGADAGRQAMGPVNMFDGAPVEGEGSRHYADERAKQESRWSESRSPFSGWGASGGADPRQWAHNYQGETNTGKYSFGAGSGQGQSVGTDSGYVPQADYPSRHGGSDWQSDPGEMLRGREVQGPTNQSGPRMMISAPFSPSPYPPVDSRAGEPTVSGNVLKSPNGLNYSSTAQKGEPSYELFRPSPFSPDGGMESALYAMKPAQYTASRAPEPSYWDVIGTGRGPSMGVEGYMQRMGAPSPYGSVSSGFNTSAPSFQPAPQKDWFGGVNALGQSLMGLFGIR